MSGTRKSSPGLTWWSTTMLAAATSSDRGPTASGSASRVRGGVMGDCRSMWGWVFMGGAG